MTATELIGPIDPEQAAEWDEDGHTFPVVGVGASAGGLEAFIDLLRHLPADPGMSFLFVQHLEPTHKSNLAEILGKVTPMPVREAAAHSPVEVNRVYII